jgi:hypothetical protein
VQFLGWSGPPATFLTTPMYFCYAGFIHYKYYMWIDRRFPTHLFTEEKFGKPDGLYYKVCFPGARI